MSHRNANASSRLSDICNALYSLLHRVSFGTLPQTFPPALLVGVWIAVSLIRIYPATLSLWEDEIWNLVVTIDSPWSVVLGLRDYVLLNHLLFSALAKILIKATGHHWVELMLRVPSLIAAALTLPIAFAAFTKAGGRRVGVIGSAVLSFMPAMSYHASSGRGYALWMLLTIWALGLHLIGEGGRGLRLRVVVCYILLAVNHGLGLVTLAGFVVAGQFLSGRKVTWRELLANAARALPALLAAIPIISIMIDPGNTRGRTGDYTLAQLTAFVPKWIDHWAGADGIPGFGMVWLAMMVVGCVSLCRAALPRACALVLMAILVPVAFVSHGETGSLSYFSTGAIPFWTLLACLGMDRIAALMGRARVTTVACAIAALAVLPWTGRLLRYNTTPKMCYRDVYKKYQMEFPQAPLFGAGDRYATGLSYYGRQFGIDYRVLSTVEEVRDSILKGPPGRGIIVPAEIETDPHLLRWIKDNLVLHETWDGVLLDACLYTAK